MLKVPLRDDSSIGSKRIYSEDKYHVELTCPQCGHINEIGNIFPMFHYGNTTGHFYCQECNHEVENAYTLESITYEDNAAYANISKSHSFNGIITLCHYVKVSMKSI